MLKTPNRLTVKIAVVSVGLLPLMNGSFVLAATPTNMAPVTD